MKKFDVAIAGGGVIGAAIALDLSRAGMCVGVFDRATGHEQVVYCTDEATGLHAIVAIYSTALGPALGGTRFYPFLHQHGLALIRLTAAPRRR